MRTQRKIEETKRVQSALHIEDGYVAGSAFDPKLQQLKKGETSEQEKQYFV
jgi:hypothetical protein